MFRSSGLFLGINCPYEQIGLCELPYCLYRHHEQIRRFKDSTKLELSGSQIDEAVNEETSGNGKHQLAQINKEIEVVRNQMEQQKRRLTSYRTSLDTTTSKNTSSVQTTKYVVDNKKPRTDLEYDPMSNYCAAPQSYKSSTEPKMRNEEALETSRPPVSGGVVPVCQSFVSSSLDHSNDDGVLVIDVAFSPEDTKEAIEPAAAFQENLSRDSSEKQDRATANGDRLSDDSFVKSADPVEQQLNDSIIVISSSSEDETEEEPKSSDAELSETDQLLECYNIFVEAEEERKKKLLLESMEAVRKPEVDSPLQPVAGKRRAAQDVEHTMLPAKIRSQPGTVVPPAEPFTSTSGSNPAVASKMERQPDASMPLTKTPYLTQTSGKQNAVLNYIPAGSTVIEMGNGFRLIITSSGMTPPTSTSPTSVLTPMGHVLPNSVPVRPLTSAAITPKYQLAAPLLISPPTRLPAIAPAPTSSKAAVTLPPEQPAVQPPAKAVPSRRKQRRQSETTNKVPHDVRQRYVSLFTEEFLKTTPDVDEAFEKALAEEKAVYNRSVNKIKYLSVAVNALKKLKNKSTLPAQNVEPVLNQKGNVPLKALKILGDEEMQLYGILKEYALSDEKMFENNFPVPHPEKQGSVVIFSEKKISSDALKRICCRCGATYSVSQTGKHTRKEECTYHYGKGVEKKVPGGVETRYSCCQGIMGAPGCQVFKLHVHDYLDLDGFITTAPRHHLNKTCPGVYSLACEMCYTINGQGVSRVSVVNSKLEVVLDMFVKSDDEVIDYNSRFSGFDEADIKDSHPTVKMVRETLMSFISADTILVGHNLERDLCLLKLVHGKVVDTSIVFPHRLGPPHKRSLKSLTAEFLRRIIQESDCSRETTENAAACMEIMFCKLKEDGKFKK